MLEQAAYLPVALLSRVVTKFGTLEAVPPRVIEGLFASDYAYLKQFYDRLNHRDGAAPVYRSVKLVLMNTTDEKLVVQGFAAITGSWCEALKPVQEVLIPAQSSVEWTSVSTEAGSRAGRRSETPALRLPARKQRGGRRPCVCQRTDEDGPPT